MKKLSVHYMAVRRFWLLLVTFSVTITTLMAQTTNWTGSSGNNWNTPGNWDNGVPTATLDVVIPSTASVQPTISTTATAKSVHVQTAASLSISSAGSLTINSFATLGGFTNAFYNEGTVTNEGTLILGNTAPVGLIGLHNVGTFTNNGTLQVDRTTNQGINNRTALAVFTNNGTITVGASTTAGTQGIWNQATFTHTGGTITIDRITSDGLLNSGDFTNSATITLGALASISGRGISNSGSFSNVTGGSIQIDQTGSHGVFMTDGTFTNAAILQIGSVSAVAGFGLQMQGTSLFTNAIGGLIRMNRCGGLALVVIGSPSFVNSATLTIGDVAFSEQDNLYLEGSGSFTNTATGEIRADRAFASGIRNLINKFRNDGKIFIGSVADTGGSGIVNGVTSSFSNNAGGLIELNRVDQGIINTNTFTNAGQILMGSSAPLQGVGIWNENNIGGAVFTNLAGATIQIDQTATGEAGITNEDSSTFTNGGTVSIGATGSIAGNALNNTGTVLNQACAVIKAFAPVYNENGTFTNNGLMTVNTLRKPTKSVVRVNAPAGLAGTYLFGTAQFGPAINTINLTADAVLVSDGTANPTQGCNPLINAAQLAGKIALVDRGTCNFSQKVYYAQQAGAIAVVVLNNQGGNPSNMATGLFADQVTIPAVMLSQADGQAIKAALTNGPVNIGINQEELISTALTNNGIISYPVGNPIPNVTNNDVIVSPISACSATFAPALQIGGANRFSVSTTWYNDQALTQPAGTYNQATNTFTATNLAVGSSRTLYFAATDNTNGCTRTVSVSVTSNSGTPTSIESLSVSGTLGSPVCRVELVGRATGASFVFTDAQGYVFSNVYRSSGTYNVVGRAVTRPGVYTLTVNNTNECGNSSSVSRTVTVSGSQCP